MTATIACFLRALQMPRDSFATLFEAAAATDAFGMPRIVRTTRFAEAEIAWRGARWLLSLPLSAAALSRIERTAPALERLNAAWLTPYRILRDELRWSDDHGVPRQCDLVLQRLPSGTDFAEALLRERPERLHEALDRLERAFAGADFAHNNLKAQNLRWTGRGFVPLRYHDAALGAPREGDAAAFEALHRTIDAAGTAPGEVRDATARYEAAPLPGHRWVSRTFEGLVCVEDEAGYGYVDTQNRPVIAAQFRWAGDFREGRAEVETDGGMGLIDREGRYVIEPRYEIVDYDPATSRVRVRRRGKWALFDYLGVQLTPFGENDNES